MSIWDIARGVSDAASFTVKKTGELTNLAKMKYALHSEQNKLKECFEEIGKLYYAYQRTGDDYVTEIAALIAEADLIKLSISKMKEEIAHLQNSAICKGCGAKIGAGMAFCPVCGLKQGCTDKDGEPCECDGFDAEDETAL